MRHNSKTVVMFLILASSSTFGATLAARRAAGGELPAASAVTPVEVVRTNDQGDCAILGNLA